jgi:hypothetical protein
MNPLKLVTELLGRPPKDLDLASHVHTSARGHLTSVSIDHRVPTSSRGSSGLRFTTKRQYLPGPHFHRNVRETINQADVAKGRRIYCVDLARNEVVAALSYHIDQRKRMPVMLTAVALRIDTDAVPDLYDWSRATAFLLKQYVHELASQIGRSAQLHIDADNVDAIRDLSDIGFVRASFVKGLRVSGTHMRQAPLT